MSNIQPKTESAPRRVLIAGCGDVGGLLATRLVARGNTVWGLRRTVAELPAGVRPLAGDLTDPARFPELPAGLDAVVYSAAPDRRDEEHYREVYARGLERLLERLGDAGQTPRRVLFTSSTGVYGQNGGEWVDEDSPTDASSWSGRWLLEAEAALAAAPWPGVAVRFGGIYGPGRGGRLVRQARSGEPCRREPPRYTNRIHREDCAAILEHLLELETPDRVYLGVDDDPAPRYEVLSFLRARLGLGPPPEPGPGEETRTGRGKRCSNAGLRSTGYRWLYPSFREGYSELLARAREES